MPAAPNEKVVLDPERITKTELRYSTKHRKFFAVFVSVLFFLATVFLLLVNIGNVSPKKGLTNMYFFKLDVTNVVPQTVPNSQLVNSLARTLGLHDFYQVGMWNYCEGYNGQGVTECSKPRLLYWFNPVQIILGELLAGATISLPAEVTKYLRIIQIASQVMFGCFFASAMTSFILIFLAPVALLSKLWTIPICIFALLSAIASTIGAGIATGMWLIFTHYLKVYAADINIIPDIGTSMFAFQWIAAGSALIGALTLAGLMCCGTSRRDIKTGRRISRSRYRRKFIGSEGNEQMPPKRKWFGGKRRAVKA